MFLKFILVKEMSFTFSNNLAKTKKYVISVKKQTTKHKICSTFCIRITEIGVQLDAYSHV